MTSGPPATSADPAAFDDPATCARPGTSGTSGTDDAHELPSRSIVLRAAGTELLVHVDRGRMPAVLHWGRPTGVGDTVAFERVRRAVRLTGVHNGLPGSGYSLGIVPEQWTGWSGRPGVTGSRAGRDWAPRFVVHEVMVDQAVAMNEFLVVAPDAGSREVTLSMSDPDTRLGLVLTLRMHPTGLVQARAQITNRGAAGYQLDGLALALPVPQRATDLLDMCGRWGKERVPQRRGMTVGAHVREGRHGRTGADAATVLHLGEPGFDFAHGEVWSVHTAWSGNHLTYAEQVLTGDQVLGGGELLMPGEVVLDHDQRYDSPWVFFNHGTGLDEIAANHHAFVRSRTPRVDADRPVTLNVWEAVYFDHDADRLLDLARRAAQLGVERFVLDDGWFGSRRDDTAGLGDWVVSPEAWPRGLHPLVDEVTRLGLQFGLWFEPEMVNPDSDLARSHPDWVLQVPGRTPLESRHQWVLDLANPAAWTHVRDQMMALLDEYDIRYIKWDHNRDLLDAGTGPDRRPGTHAQTLAFYRLVDELKAAHPGLEIESCSSGGARIDLEVVQHCDRVWVSDNIDPSDRQQMMRWTAQLLPPEFLGSHIASGASHTTGRTHTLAHRAATAVFGHLGIEWDLAEADDDELAELGRWIAWYKRNRSVLNDGRMVRVYLPQAPTGFLHGVVTPARAIFAFTPLELARTWSIGTIQLPGLDPDAAYRLGLLDLTGGAVQHQDGDLPWQQQVFTGRELAMVGVRAPDVRPEQTCIIVLDRVE